MHFASFLQWLHDTHFSAVMRESLWAEPIVETIHVLTLTLFFGFAVMLDLRLMGLFWQHRRMSEVLRQLNLWLFAGYVIMIVSGVLLFCADPISFWTTIFFRIKMVLLVLAGLNVMIFNRTVGRKIAAWDLSPRTPLGAKLAGVISLVLWVAIIAAGRAIAYALPPP